MVVDLYPKRLGVIPHIQLQGVLSGYLSIQFNGFQVVELLLAARAEMNGLDSCRGGPQPTTEDAYFCSFFTDWDPMKFITMKN